MTRILVVEDEQKMAASLEKGLVAQGYTVDIITNGLDARLKNIKDYDVVILDWMLPHIEGIEVLRYWRQQKYTTPVLMLTARDLVPDKVHGLDIGADDYMSKYFDWSELLARLKALIRRNSPSNLISQVGSLEYNRKTGSFSENGIDISLTATETQILVYFFDNPHKIISTSSLVRVVYDHAQNPYSNVIARHIKSIRSKIQYDPIETIRNMGYRLRLK